MVDIDGIIENVYNVRKGVYEMAKEVQLKPVSMYTITAKLMNHLVASVEKELGDRGLTLLKQGVENFVVELNEILETAPNSYILVDDETFSFEKLIDAKKVEQTYKKFAHAQDVARVEQLVSIYSLMAKVFGHVTKVIVEAYGDIGENAIRQGVWTFGKERGRHIAERAKSVGKPNTIENYLTHYDMGRSDLFEYETIYREQEIEQTFTKCAFGDQWKKDGMHQYGILYCQMIDPAIAKGYNPNFEVVHDEYILKEGCCHFLFQMKKR